MKFDPVDPNELEKSFESRRGRVSYPIIKGFMETGLYASKVNFEDDTRKPATMYILLKSYVSNHDVPVKVLLRRNRVILVRLDIDKDGNKVEDWRKLRDPLKDDEGEPSTAISLADDVEKL